MEIPLDQRERVKELFDAALQLDPVARSSFLDHSCSQDSMRRIVEDLLLSYDEAGSFLSRSSFGARSNLFWVESFVPGTILAGRFHIARFIARGGIGEVYEAEDMELGQQVRSRLSAPTFLSNLTSWPASDARYVWQKLLLIPTSAGFSISFAIKAPRRARQSFSSAWSYCKARRSAIGYGEQGP